MPAMRDLSAEEISLLRKSFSGRYALRDRCYFEMGLQLGLRVSEMLSITVGQVYHGGTVPEALSIERRHMKGGKSGKASGRTLPIFPETKPHIMAWLLRMAQILGLTDPQAIDPNTPLFISRVHKKGIRAIRRETVWKFLTNLCRENGLSGSVGTHGLRKTLARSAQVEFKGDVRKVQKILGHRSLSSTEHYLRSLSDQEVWQEYRSLVA
jgi:integrase